MTYCQKEPIYIYNMYILIVKFYVRNYIYHAGFVNQRHVKCNMYICRSGIGGPPPLYAVHAYAYIIYIIQYDVHCRSDHIII